MWDFLTTGSTTIVLEYNLIDVYKESNEVNSEIDLILTYSVRNWT